MVGIPVFSADGKTVVRSLTLVGSVLSALASGTNYVFSAYAPQLASRLHIDHTRLNVIALAGNVGVNSTGPVWGAIADSRGPKSLYLIAIGMLLVGYIGIKLFYDGVFNLPDNTTHNSPSFAFLALVLFAYLTGAGSHASFTGSVNAVARSFSDVRRSTAVGFVISGFGLSAFFFSTIAHTAFSDDTSAFLAVLVLGTTIPNVIAYFLVRIVHDDERPGLGKKQRAGYSIIGDANHDYPPAGLERRLHELDEERRISDPTYTHAKGTGLPPLHPHPNGTSEGSTERTRSPSLASSFDLPYFGNPVSHAAQIPPVASSHDLEDMAEHAIMRDSSNAGHDSDSDDLVPSNSGDPESIPELLKRGDFWLMCGVITLLAGTGLMWINNVGSIAQALVSQGKPTNWDKARAAKVQAAQVSVVSVMNCLGRLLIGVIADHGKHSLGIRRCFWLIPISLLFILSQIIARNTTTPDTLWLSSACVGMSYGAMFSLAPNIAIEWFGLGRFSLNWGMITISPVVGGNIFSLAFGMILDRHASQPNASTGSATHRALHPRGGSPDSSDHLCFDGLECYQSSLDMTILACVAATFLSILAFRRDKLIYAIRDHPMGDASASPNSDNRHNRAQRSDPTEEEEGLLLSSQS